MASQKFTWLAVNGADPADTVAVAVTSVPDATVDTELPPAVSDRAVAEEVCVDRIVTASGAVAVREPEVPVIVAVVLAGAAPGDAVSVSVLLVDEGLGAKEAVTPLGRPLTT